MNSNRALLVFVHASISVSVSASASASVSHLSFLSLGLVSTRGCNNKLPRPALDLLSITGKGR